MAHNILLTLNPGSSTIKLGLFAIQAGKCNAIGRGAIDLRHAPLTLHIEGGARSSEIEIEAAVTDDLHGVLDETLSRLTEHLAADTLVAVAHRVVHGGDRFTGPIAITDDTLAAIEALAPLAPLHQPKSLQLIHAVRHLRPDLPQTASFDTAFHRSQSDLVRRFALPRPLFDQGIKRYGFHGLSYKRIADRLAQSHPALAAGRVVVAHLGSGASLCGLDAGVSRDTSMSFSVLDGIPMATRCGALDPGVLLHLMKHEGMTADAIEDMLYHQSGLLGVSGISADTRELAESEAPEAREALALFALRTAREAAAIATTLGGVDAIVFTAGIGEHQPAVRAAICGHLEWLGARLDPAANARHAARIDAPDSRIALLVMATDEEQVIAEEACEILYPHAPDPLPEPTP
ncbi:MAG: acetate/propionate family kinase [Variovorax sp.]